VNWDAIGALAELAGAIAVFATLVYLAVQVKQSNKLALAQYRESNRLAMVDLSDPIIRDSELAELIESTKSESAVASVADLRRVRLQLQNELLVAQSLFVRGKLMGEDRMESVSCTLAVNTINSHPIAKDIWEGTEYNENFIVSVKKRLNDVGA